MQEVNRDLQQQNAELRQENDHLRTKLAHMQAEQARSQELAKVNVALKRSLDALAADSDLNQFISHVLKTVAEQLDAPVVEYWSTSNNTAYLELTCWQGQVLNREQIVDDPRTQVVVVPPELAAHEALSQRQQHFIVDDLPSDPLHVRLFSALKFDLEVWCNQHKVRRELNVPLWLGANTIGSLCVYVPAERPFTEQQVELSYTLAQQVTLAIRLTQLAEEAKQAAIAREQERAAQQRAAELHQLNQALQAEIIERQRAEQVSSGQTEALTRTLTVLAAEPVLDNFLGYVLQAIAEQLGDPSGGIWLYDDTYHTTILHINYEKGVILRGDQIDRPGSIRQIIQQWDVDYVQVLRDQRILIQDVQQLPDTPDYAPYRAYNQQHGIRTILVIPLFFGDTFLGNITLRSTQPRNYQPEELELARALAYQATLAIQLTHLSNQSQRSAVLAERNRLARDIHDTIAQGLAGIIVQLQAAEDPQTPPDDRRTHIQTARQLAKYSLTEARRSVQALRPHALNGGDLPIALTRLVEQVTANTGITVERAIQKALYPLASEIENHLLRIAQESLTNVLKHAQADHVYVELTFEAAQVHLCIEDNGRGFQPELVNTGFGLTSMQERSQIIQAQLTIKSQPEVGTTIRVIVPLSSLQGKS